MCMNTPARLTAGAVPDDGPLLSVTISSCWTGSAGAPLPVLGPRAALRSGRLALGELNLQVQTTAPAGAAPEPAAFPPLPMSLSVVAGQ